MEIEKYKFVNDLLEMAKNWNEKIDIVAVNDDTLNNFARLLVPAHNQDDYELAKK